MRHIVMFTACLALLAGAATAQVATGTPAPVSATAPKLAMPAMPSASAPLKTPEMPKMPEMPKLPDLPKMPGMPSGSVPAFKPISGSMPPLPMGMNDMCEFKLKNGNTIMQPCDYDGMTKVKKLTSEELQKRMMPPALPKMPDIKNLSQPAGMPKPAEAPKAKTDVGM